MIICNFQITYAALGVRKELKKAAQSGLVEFVTPDPLNEVEIRLHKKRKKALSSTLYHQVFTPQTNFTVGGFNLYLVQALKRTTILAVSGDILASEHRKLRSCKKKKSKHNLLSNKFKVSQRNSRNFKKSSKKIFRAAQTPFTHTSYYNYRVANENTTMVLSTDQFVFRPEIPINETNYPLDNVDKQELFASEVPVEKILSYGFTDPAIKNYIKFPSVSKIIEETISDKTRQVLANWRQKMIADLGEDGFFNHSEGKIYTNYQLLYC